MTDESEFQVGDVLRLEEDLPWWRRAWRWFRAKVLRRPYKGNLYTITEVTSPTTLTVDKPLPPKDFPEAKVIKLHPEVRDEEA